MYYIRENASSFIYPLYFLFRRFPHSLFHHLICSLLHHRHHHIKCQLSFTPYSLNTLSSLHFLVNVGHSFILSEESINISY